MRGRGLFAWGIVLLTLGLLLFGAALLLGRYSAPTTTVTVGGMAFKATVVSTEKSREQGLGGTDRLADGTGMLFVFPADGPQGIWMKDMNYSIDIVWLNAAKKVVNIQANATPDSYPRHIYQSPVPARYVLEIPAGSAARAGITKGKTAAFDLPGNLKIE